MSYPLLIPLLLLLLFSAPLLLFLLLFSTSTELLVSSEDRRLVGCVEAEGMFEDVEDPEVGPLKAAVEGVGWEEEEEEEDAGPPL